MLQYSVQVGHCKNYKKLRVGEISAPRQVASPSRRRLLYPLELVHQWLVCIPVVVLSLTYHQLRWDEDDIQAGHDGRGSNGVGDDGGRRGNKGMTGDDADVSSNEPKGFADNVAEGKVHKGLKGYDEERGWHNRGPKGSTANATDGTHSKGAAGHRRG